MPVIIVTPLSSYATRSKREGSVKFSCSRLDEQAALKAAEAIECSRLIRNTHVNGADITVRGSWHWPFRGLLINRACRAIMEQLKISEAVAEIHRPLPGENRQGVKLREIYAPPLISAEDVARVRLPEEWPPYC